MPTPAIGPIDQAHRRLAELDDAVIDAIHARIEAQGDLIALRRAAGLPETELARENEVLRRYNEALGSAGTTLALLLLERGRGAASRITSLASLPSASAFGLAGTPPGSDRLTPSR
ncbi:hypothetical protein [Streptomyces sp. NPDC057718]|uniref:hypothetical protein n=1 Tax=Streptomyces sp. NPDC057718 TaxID=3346225 RepID=UPI0036A3FFB9